jgi:hypothetical protein
MGYGLSVVPQNQREDGESAEHASKSNGFLHVEASWARVFQFSSKLVEMRQRVVHVAPSWRSREDQIEDGRVDATGYIRLGYPYIAIFFVLCSTDIYLFVF